MTRSVEEGGRPVLPDCCDRIRCTDSSSTGATQYGQAIFEAAEMLDISPGSADTLRYAADLAEDRAPSRGALDAVCNGPDGMPGTDDDFDAILFSANSGAGTPARAGYPSVTVPGGFLPPAGGGARVGSRGPGGAAQGTPGAALL